ncbi:MAG: hypothetical protein ACP5QK_05760 [Myxococcota bacterium]
MKGITLVFIIFFSINLFADDMTFTTIYPSDRSGISIGMMPKNMPDRLGYKGSETTITPLFFSGRYVTGDLIIKLNIPLVINPDESKDDIMLNTILLDLGYLRGLNDFTIISGIQFTPALNIGSNIQNDLENNLSFYAGFFDRAIENFDLGVLLQYYQSLADKKYYGGLYITRANSGFSTELKAEYYFYSEKLTLFSDLLLFRDLSNGISNIYLNPGVRFLIGELNTVYVSLSIPLYDDKFCDRYGSGLNLYYDLRF